MTDKNDNIVLLDLFKLLFAIEIVAGHARYLFKNIIIREIVAFIGGSGIAFFFMASGYLLYSRAITNNVEDIINCVVKSIRSMCRRYAVWSILGLPLAIYEFVHWKTGFCKGIVFYLRDAIFRGEHYSGAPTWYILSSIYSLVVIYVILKITGNEKYIFFMIPLSLAGYYIILGLLKINSSNDFILLIINNTIGMFKGRMLMGFWLIPAGILIAKVRSRIKPIYVWIAFPIILCVRKIIGYGEISDLIFIFNFLLCILTINIRWGGISLCVRRISTLTYFSHMFFITGILLFNGGVYDDEVFYISIMFSVAVGVLFHIFIQKDFHKEFWKLFI